MLNATRMTTFSDKGQKMDERSPIIYNVPAKSLKKVLNSKTGSLEHPATHKYGMEQFPRPFSGVSQNDAAFALRTLQTTPGPGAYNVEVAKRIKGGQFPSNKRGYIESLCWRAAAEPGPAHYNVDVEFQYNVHASISSRLSTSRIGFNNTRGSFSMSGVPPVTQSVKSIYCVCANNWTCHFCSGAPKRAPSSIHKHLVALKQHRFHSDSDPVLAQLRAVSPNRGHTRSGKVVFAENHR